MLWIPSCCFFSWTQLLKEFPFPHPPEACLEAVSLSMPSDSGALALCLFFQIQEFFSSSALPEKLTFFFSRATHITSFLKTSTNVKGRILFVLFSLYIALHIYLCYGNMFIEIISVNLIIIFSFPLYPFHTPVSSPKALPICSVSRATLLCSYRSRHLRKLVFKKYFTYSFGHAGC